MIEIIIDQDQQINFCQHQVLEVLGDPYSLMIFKIKADEEFPAKWVNLIEDNKFKKLTFLDYFIIELSQELDIACENWLSDEDISKETALANSLGLRWNDLDERTEYNFMRKIPDNLNPLFYKYIDLEYAEIEDVRYSFNNFELVLNAPLSSTSEDEIGLNFHSGPFRFKGKKLKLVLF